jgi:hypothetical protein
MARVAWSRSLDRNSRDPLLGTNFAYLPEQGISCVDREGVVRWTRPTAVGRPLPTDMVLVKVTGDGAGSPRFDVQPPTHPPGVGLCPLPGDRVLAWDGGPVVLDERGSEVHRWRGGPVEYAEWIAGTILLHGTETVYIAGADLAVRREFRRPASFPVPSWAHTESAVYGESLYWGHRDGLMAWTPEREVHRLVEIPPAHMVQACARYEERTGRTTGFFGRRFVLHEGRMHGVDAEDPSCLGSEFKPQWKVILDRRAQLAFLTAPAPAPSFVACVGLDGTFRWVEVMGHHCCGGLPRALPDGGYVVSQNCNERIVWFDREGQVRHLRNQEHGDVSVLASGVTLVAHDGGVFAYGLESEPLWQLERPRPSLIVNEEGTAFLMRHYAPDDSSVTVELVDPTAG